MERPRGWLRELWPYSVIGFVSIPASGCSSSPASSGLRGAGVTAASNNGGIRINVVCIGDRINNSPGVFHYS